MKEIPALLFWTCFLNSCLSEEHSALRATGEDAQEGVQVTGCATPPLGPSSVRAQPCKVVDVFQCFLKPV